MKIEMIRTLTFSRSLQNSGIEVSSSVSKDDGGKVATWFHSHVK